MRITPIDIAHKTFSRKVMGVDGEEVTEFLRDIADQMEEIIRERNSLKEALRDKELSISEYRDRDESLKGTLMTATRMTEQIRQDAEKEAQLIVQDAQQKADLIVADARDSLKRIYQEISELKRSRMQFDASLRSLLHAHLSMLDQAHTMIPDPQITVGRPTAPSAAAPAGAQAATPAPMQAAAGAASRGAQAAAAFDARMPRPTTPFPK